MLLLLLPNLSMAWGPLTAPVPPSPWSEVALAATTPWNEVPSPTATPWTEVA